MSHKKRRGEKNPGCLEGKASQTSQKSHASCGCMHNVTPLVQDIYTPFRFTFEVNIYPVFIGSTCSVASLRGISLNQYGMSNRTCDSIG